MKIIMTGGGTLGPVTPLLAVVRALRELAPETEVVWIGTEGGPEKRLVTEAGIPFRAISSGKLRRYFSWRNFTDPFRIIKGFFEAKRMLRELRADVVVSAGGFVAVPVVWAAGLMRIPAHVHQQDLRPGLANRLCLPFASSVSVALEASLDKFAAHAPFWTGNPVRAELRVGSREEAKRLFHLEDGVPTVLALGGGTGAAGVNDLVRSSLQRLAEGAQVIHVTGAGKAQGGESTRYRQYEFLSAEMKHAFACADLVVTRAGMGVLTELAALGLPAVIIPMPGSHQEDNARLFAKAGAGLVIEERTTFSKGFSDAVLGLLKDPARLATMRKAMLGMSRQDADKRLAELILKTARNHRP